MPAFPRDIQPKGSTPFHMPGALQAWGETGKSQHRATGQIGRIWSETLDIFKADSIAGRKLLTFLENAWRNGTQFTIEHYLYLAKLGLGTGSPTVNGAGQTGATLSTANWTGSNPVMRAGDIMRIAGISWVIDVTDDAPNLAAGVTSLSINPPFLAGLTPANGALITHVGPVLLNAFLFQEPQIPEAASFGYISNLRLVFREAV